MKGEIKKCKICDEPYWTTIYSTIEDGSLGVCPDCVEIADKKRDREINQPIKFEK